MSDKIKICVLNGSDSGVTGLSEELTSADLDFEFHFSSSESSLLSDLKAIVPDFVVCFDEYIKHDWIEALRICKQFLPDAPFILINVTGSREVAQTATARRADHLIHRDMYFRIPGIIKRELDIRETRRELFDLKFNAPKALDKDGEAKAPPALKVYESSLDELEEIVLIKDVKSGVYIYSNKAAEKILGLRKEFVRGKKADGIFDKFKARYFDARDDEQIEKRAPVADAEDLAFTVTKGVRAFHTRRFLLLDEDNNPDKILTLAEDVTDKKKRVYDLEKCEIKAQKIMRSLPIAIAVVNESDFKASFFNQAFADIFKIDADSPGEVDFNELFDDADRDIIREAIDNAVKTGSSKNVEFGVLGATGEPIDLLMSVDYISVDPSESFFLFTFNDISKIVEAENHTLNNLDREKELGLMKSRFLSVVGHELRNPLTTITISTDLLKRHIKQMSDEDAAKQFDRIQRTVQSMIVLIEKVMTIGKMDSGKFDFSPENIDLQSFCRSIIDSLEYGKTKQSIRFVFKGDSVYANADETLLALILNNLLGNALKYSPDEKEVALEVSCSVAGLELVVKDSGIGIPENDLHDLFRTFYRASNTGEIPGYGLGLAIVEKCVSAHSGTITVESKVGEGTTFTVFLPAGSAE